MPDVLPASFMDRGQIGTAKGKNRVTFGDMQDPRATMYAHGTRRGNFILKADEGGPALRRAVLAAKEVVADGGTVMFVGGSELGDEKLAIALTEFAAEQPQVVALTSPWMKGLLTNWREFEKGLSQFRLERSRSLLVKGARSNPPPRKS